MIIKFRSGKRHQSFTDFLDILLGASQKGCFSNSKNDYFREIEHKQAGYKRLFSTFSVTSFLNHLLSVNVVVFYPRNSLKVFCETRCCFVRVFASSFRSKHATLTKGHIDSSKKGHKSKKGRIYPTI